MKQTKTKIIMITFIAALIVAGVLFYRNRSVEAAWFNNSWHYRKQLTFNNADQSDNLTDFPVMVKLTSANFLFSKAKSSGEDVRFTDSDGETLLKYEIEKWDADNEEAIIWVKVPQIDGSSATDSIYIYYGNAEASDGQDAENVWNSDYEMVQHLQEDPAVAGAGGIVDSTSNNNDGTDNGSMDAADQVAGQIDGSLDFDGGDDYVDAGDITTFGDRTITFWFNTSDTSNSMGIMRFSSTWTGISFTTSSNKPIIYFNGGGMYRYYEDISAYLDGNWHFGTVILNNADPLSSKFYIDNTELSASSSVDTGSPEDLDSVQIGHSGYGYFNGTLDEIRVSTSARSADWIAATYLSESDTFINQSDEEHQGHPVAYWSFDEGYGAEAHDETVNGNDGTITNAVWQEEDMCVSGKCLYFDGTGDFVNGGDTVDLQIEDFTVLSWIYINTGVANDGLITKWDSATRSGWGLYESTGDTLRLSVGTPQANISSNNNFLTEGEWIFVTVVKSGLDVNFYRNTVSWGSGALSNDISSSSGNDLFIGRLFNDTDDYYFNGTIDEIKIYDYARSAAEIKLDYQNSSIARGAAVSIGDKSDSWMSDGLVGYWKMDESSWTEDSADVVDSSGNGNTGTVKDDATVAAGKFGNGGSFDGNGDYVDVGNDSSLQITGELSIEAWVKTSVKGKRVVSKDDGSSRCYLLRTDTSSGVPEITIFKSNSAYTLEATTDITDNQWYHVVGINEGTDLKIYVDGVLENTGVGDGGTIDNDAENLEIGRLASDTEYFNGSIDSVRIYNRALSEKEVRDLYNWAPGPVMHLKMDEKAGDFAYDISGNENIGRMHGPALSFDGGDYVEIADTDDLSFGDGSDDDPFSVEAWVNMTDATDFKIYSKGIYNGGDYELVFHTHDDDTLRFAIADESVESCLRGRKTAAVTSYEDQWVHFVATYNGVGGTNAQDGMNIYVNGVDSDTDDISAGTYVAMENLTHDIWIGRYNDSYTSGKIDEVRIYDDVLTAAEVLQHYNGEYIDEDNLVGYWDFSENTGQYAYDQSTNTNTGTLGADADASTDDPTWVDYAPDWTNGKIGSGLEFDGGDDFVEVGDFGY